MALIYIARSGRKNQEKRFRDPYHLFGQLSQEGFSDLLVTVKATCRLSSLAYSSLRNEAVANASYSQQMLWLGGIVFDIFS